MCKWDRTKITFCNDMRYSKNTLWNWPYIELLEGEIGNIGVDEARKTFVYLTFWGQKMRYGAKTHLLFWRNSTEFNRLAWPDPHLHMDGHANQWGATQSVDL